VDYKPTSQIPAPSAKTLDDALAALFIKRSAFKHEAEYGLIVYDKNRESHDRLLVPVNPDRLILSVLADPRAPDEMVKVFEFFLAKKLQFTGNVAKSVLYARTEPPASRGKKSERRSRNT
jgi:hypothetical protein